MAWAPLLLAVLAHGSGSLVQAAVTQLASVSASPGDTVRITCSGSGYCAWYRQKDGSAPVTVIYWNNQRPSGIPVRFSGSTSGTTCILTITGVQAEDEAVYYCGGYAGSCSAATLTPSNGEVSPRIGPFPIVCQLNGSARASIGSLVQAAVTQQLASVSVSPGETAWVTCSGSTGSYSWFQQKPGSELLTVVCNNSKRLRFLFHHSVVPGTRSIQQLLLDPLISQLPLLRIRSPVGVGTRSCWDRAMAWAPLLLVVLAHGSGSLVQAAVTQLASVSASPGETVRITCSGSGYCAWYRQKDGSAPVTVIYWNNQRPSGIPVRFSGSVSGSTCTLTITGVQAEDEAVYYCGGCGTGGAGFGAGTQLTVLGQPKSSPTVHLFPPSTEEISETNKATLVCLLAEFYPGVVDVVWKVDGSAKSSGVETTKPQKQSNNSKYMASSYLALTASDWKSHETYTCEVTHDGKKIEKVLKRSECSS
ncbi:uncharacterized protein LOC134148381 [Rhea pennata]|uniref:uncharacterized protein LOC134148381 n=1 Tax=Rhea pennata TaxID=8795 RepID=UPI002E2660F8